MYSWGTSAACLYMPIDTGCTGTFNAKFGMTHEGAETDFPLLITHPAHGETPHTRWQWMY